VEITCKDVLEVAVTFKNEMLKIGKGFSFAKARDITKTYHYRWFNSFLKKCYDNGMNLEESKEVIKSIISYAKEKGIINKGVSLISRSDIIEICMKRMEDDLKQSENSIAVIKRLVNGLNEIDDLTNHLCKKKNRHGSTNMMIMKSNGKLTDATICLSKSCMKAFLFLKDEDKEGLLTLREYVLLKHKVINKIGYDVLFDIFGDDFNGKK
jgi:hypothetical protein